MDHLPAYVALERWVVDRSVVVVKPGDASGPARLRAAGARQVAVSGSVPGASPGIERLEGAPRIGRPDRTVDVVCCIEAYGEMSAPERRELLSEAERVLARNGVLVVWLPVSAPVDFWTMEDELTTAFSSVFIVAQIPWRGYSLAPVLDEGEPAGLELDEGLLREAPAATHYLAVACNGRAPPRIAEDCLLVPIPGEDDVGDSRVAHELQLALQRAEAELGAVKADLKAAEDQRGRLREELELRGARAVAAQARVKELESALERAEANAARAEEVEDLRSTLAERERERDQARAVADAARDKLRAGDTDLQVLSRTVEEQERALARATEMLEARSRDLEARQRQHEESLQRLRELAAEREELTRQVEVATAEREGARQLANRVETELELARKRIGRQERELASKIEEASRVSGELAALQQRLEAQESMLARTQSRAEELKASAAQSVEQGRMLSEVAVDRDRLREELTRRGTELGQLEERLWEVREELQQERLGGARVAAQLDAMREQAERSRASEQARVQEVEQLSAELRSVELERAELKALLRSREEALERMARDAQAIGDASGDVQALQSELRERSRELGALTTKLEQARAREADARALVEKHEDKLERLGEQLERARRESVDAGRIASGLRSDLEVKQLEVEQMAEAVEGLQRELEGQRESAGDQDRERARLQERLEESAAEQRLLRNRLREAEQAVADNELSRRAREDELTQLRRELADARRAAQDMAGALGETGKEEAEGRTKGAGSDASHGIDSSWPAPARALIRKLQTQVADQARRHADALETRGAPATEPDSDRLRRLQLEVEIRAQEQEVMLSELERAEQKIWEMSDASDRNAARLAASLAQLERNKETLDQTVEELEVSNNLLAAAQARALEQERLLGSERAKLARAGVGPDGLPQETVASGGSVDQLFQELNPVPKPMVDLDSSPIDVTTAEAGAPATTVEDRGGSRASASRRLEGSGPKGPRVVVEEIEDDGGSWPMVTEPPTPLRPKRDEGDEGP